MTEAGCPQLTPASVFSFGNTYKENNMSLWRCSNCDKAGLEDDFVFVPIDELHETIFCFECAPDTAMKQIWHTDEFQDNPNDSNREKV